MSDQPQDPRCTGPFSHAFDCPVHDPRLQQPAPAVPLTEQFDLLEHPTRGLHAVLTRHGIASRTDYQALVTALVHWSADACRSTFSAQQAALREALEDYGFHKGDCAVSSGRNCTCGWADVVARLLRAEPGSEPLKVPNLPIEFNDGRIE